jgi:23S rRNA pseudouridine2605 synthase
MKIRLQKQIADCGYCSRRKAEEFIKAGKVTVNGKITSKLGSKVEPTDKIVIKGTRLKAIKENTTIALNKPAGYVTTRRDPRQKDTVMKLLPRELRHLKPAGRLDKESEGLLIMSSDGELIQALTHPSFQHTKTYEVLVKGIPTEKNLAPLEGGHLKLDGKTLQDMPFRILKKTRDRKTWIQIILREGRNRQIRRVMDSLGYPVVYLRRIKVGELNLDDLGKLEKGEYKKLTEKEIEQLKQI